jgi:glycosyltransferase involved in cell wall biosynthesis
MRLAIVIPAYNEARTIRVVAQGALREASVVIVVDDGSTDGTIDALTGLPVRLVRHPSNMGKAAALWSGFDVALAEGVDYVATVSTRRPTCVAWRRRRCFIHPTSSSVPGCWIGPMPR